MDDLARWSLVVGFLLPWAVAIVQQENWDKNIRALCNFVICIVAAIGTVYFSGKLDVKDLISSSLLILVTAITTYKGLWEPTGIAPFIEHATSARHNVAFHMKNLKAVGPAPIVS